MGEKGKASRAGSSWIRQNSDSRLEELERFLNSGEFSYGQCHPALAAVADRGKLT